MLEEQLTKILKECHICFMSVPRIYVASSIQVVKNFEHKNPSRTLCLFSPPQPH